MSQIIQIASHGLSLVALCEDGQLWRQFQDGTGWTRVDVPDAMMPRRIEREPAAMPFTILDQADTAGERDAITDCTNPEPPCNGAIPSLYTPSEWPEGAEWWAVDENQTAWFYRDEPRVDQVASVCSQWISNMCAHEIDNSYIRNAIPDWKTSLRRKPQNNQSAGTEAQTA